MLDQLKEKDGVALFEVAYCEFNSFFSYCSFNIASSIYLQFTHFVNLIAIPIS